MTKAKWMDLILQMQSLLDTINAIQTQPGWVDPRRLAIAAIHLETAILWVSHTPLPSARLPRANAYPRPSKAGEPKPREKKDGWQGVYPTGTPPSHGNTF